MSEFQDILEARDVMGRRGRVCPQPEERVCAYVWSRGLKLSQERLALPGTGLVGMLRGLICGICGGGYGEIKRD